MSDKPTDAPIRIPLKELAGKSGKTEVEIAMSIIELLDMKARIYGITQRVRMEVNDAR